MIAYNVVIAIRIQLQTTPCGVRVQVPTGSHSLRTLSLR
jgi:hypothetical protein